jgi:hypothetical protein
MRVEKILSLLIVVVLAAAAIVFGVKLSGRGGEETASVRLSTEGDASLLVIGVHGLEASILDPLLAEGRLPNIARLVDGGARMSFSTLGRDVDSRIVWTSLVTGMLPENQGVGGQRMSRRGEMVDAPLMPKSRTVGALWTYVGEAGGKSAVLCWQGTWPVEQIEGIMVGPHSTYVLERFHGGRPEDGVSPVAERERIDPLMLERDVFKRRDLARFVDLDSSLGLEALVGQNYTSLAGACAADRSAVDLARLLASDGDITSLFVGLPGIDAASQRFWHYMETEAIERVDVSGDMRRLLEGQVEALGTSVERYYEYTDELVGELVVLAGEGATIAIVTDHGYRGIRLDAAGMPLVGTDMHSEEGMLILRGPRVSAGAEADPGELIDVAPTIMAAAGLDLPDGLDGRAHEEIITR